MKVQRCIDVYKPAGGARNPTGYVTNTGRDRFLSSHCMRRRNGSNLIGLIMYTKFVIYNWTQQKLLNVYNKTLSYEQLVSIDLFSVSFKSNLVIRISWVIRLIQESLKEKSHLFMNQTSTYCTCMSCPIKSNDTYSTCWEACVCVKAGIWGPCAQIRAAAPEGPSSATHRRSRQCRNWMELL